MANTGDILRKVKTCPHRWEDVLTNCDMRIARRCRDCLEVVELRTCDYCADTFDVTASQQIYCSSTCEVKGKAEKILDEAKQLTKESP